MPIDTRDEATGNPLDDVDDADDVASQQGRATPATPAIHITPDPVEPAKTVEQLNMENMQLRMQLLEGQLREAQLREEQLRSKQQSSSSSSDSSFKMINPDKYCGGAKELELFLATIRANFEAHSRQFPSEATKVTYAINLLSTWASHPDPQQRRTNFTDPLTFGQELRLSSHPCLHDFELFAAEMTRFFGSKERRWEALGRLIKEVEQGADEPVRIWAQRITANWREAGWKDTGVADDRADILYDLAWLGLRPYLRARIYPLVDETGRFSSVEELFDKAAAAEPSKISTPSSSNNKHSQDRGKSTDKQHLEVRRPASHQQHQQRSRSEPRKDSSSSKSSNSAHSAAKPSAPWIPMELFKSRIAEGKCVRCGRAGHEGKDCRTYAPAKRPRSDSAAAEAPAIKRSRSTESLAASKN